MSLASYPCAGLGRKAALIVVVPIKTVISATLLVPANRPEVRVLACFILPRFTRLPLARALRFGDPQARSGEDC
jgi:hypothetical protein